jgi:hypothetical protein
VADAGFFDSNSTSAGKLDTPSNGAGGFTTGGSAGGFTVSGSVGGLAVDARSLDLGDLGAGLAGVFEFRTVVDRTPPAATGEVDLLIGGTQFAVSSGTTIYMGAAADTTEAEASVPVPALTATELFVASSVAPGSGETFTFTLRKNGTATAVVATISGTSTTANASGSVLFAAGDLFSVSLVTSSGAATASASFSVKRQFAS